MFNMFKIQNFLNFTRNLLSKLPKYNSKYQSSLIPPLTKFFTLLPATCWLGINFSSMERLKIKNINSIQPEIERVIYKSLKKDVRELMIQVIAAMKDENLHNARALINEGIQISEENNFSEYLPYFYDWLITINMREGNLSEAEEILVRSIEKLTEVGYKETDNEIVQFQLTLARLYQANGNKEMAGIGFRNCISVQETKCEADAMDEPTKALYLSLLFWYSIFLTDENRLHDSKNYMKRALELTKTTMSLEPGQIIVILYNLAELSFRLKEYDDVIKYLVDGLRLCLQNLSLDSALPVFMVKLGLTYLIKGMYETAEYWCSIAQIFAKSSHNACAENESSLCLKQLEKEKSESSKNSSD